MPRRVFLVRHGEVANPRHVVYADLPGFTLNASGVAQAEAAASLLEAVPLAAVVSSPLERAQETATILARPHGLVPEIDPRLTEWLLGRRWAGTVWEELPKRFPGELEAYLATPDLLDFSPERLAGLAERMAAAIEDAAARHRGPCAIVSHQDPIQAARLYLTGRPLAGLHATKPAHASVVTLDETTGWVESGYWEPRQTG
jgi:broad specificity phosphatase PhoE